MRWRKLIEIRKFYKNKFMNNIEKFNKCAAEIFSRLYEKFPIGTDIKIDEFPQFKNLEDEGIFNETVKFLINEGFIRCDFDSYDSYLNVVLTSKGFITLNSIPEAISNKKEALGDKLKEVLKTGKEEGIKSMIREIIKLFLFPSI